MGILPAPAQVRRAPVLALRAVFAGFGRLLMLADRPAPVVAGQAPDARPAPAYRPAPGSPPAPGSRPTPGSAPTSADADEASRPAGLPLANYDGLSLASIRARLRGLDVAQLKVLLDYEAANAERADVLGMFERRIEKLETGP